MDPAAANFVRAEIAARVGPILQIERVQRVPIRGDIRGSCQGAFILPEVVSFWSSIEHTAARPRTGRFTVNIHRERPLQGQHLLLHRAFVAAAPSRVLRDGAGMLLFKLAHHSL